MKLDKKTVLLKVDGELRDISGDYSNAESIEELDASAPEVLEVFRHSCAHLLAQAVMELYPDAQYGIGPALDTGFYYDFLVKEPFTAEDLDNISKKMKFLVKKNIRVEREVVDKKLAVDMFRNMGQHLKAELIDEKVEGNDVTLYRQGDFVDFCRGPHLPATGLLKNFKLQTVAAAYWKGDENSHSMQRIYGVVFPGAEELAAHLQFLKEAKDRDHRKIGKELDLFSIQNETGPGLVLWHPKGSIIRHEIEKYWKEEHLKSDYDLLYTPHIAKSVLWDISGHNSFYKDDMFKSIGVDEYEYQLKPMNCPFHIMVYREGRKSYRDLPLKWAELGTVYRYEKSGALQGLFRVRGFTQDDAHLFCTEEQLNEEVEGLISFSLKLLNTFGFNNVDVYLSTQPEKYVGEQKDWDIATEALKSALEKLNVKYTVDPGEGVFYGPKIDIKVKDTLGRAWQCTTIQADFNLPKRFDLKYIDKDGSEKRPIMIHRALLGSMERFFGILIENYAGFFPLWLSPVQVSLLQVTDRNADYAEKVYKKMKDSGLRVELDNRSEGVGRKIRDAEIKKVPYIVIIGDEEEKSGNLSYRIHKKGDQGSIDTDRFIEGVNKLMRERRATYEL
jgi:threonyl-tRNA synthetase